MLAHCRLPGPTTERPEPDSEENPTTAPTAGAPGKPLGPVRLLVLTTCMLPKLSDNWLVDGRIADPIRFQGKPIGLFLGGAQTVAYDVNFFECAGELSGTNDREAYARQLQREANPVSSDDDLERDENGDINRQRERRLPYGGYREAIAELAGLPLYLPQPAYSRSLIPGEEANYYNPDLIRWAGANLVPDPGEPIAENLLYQTVYDRVLRRSARILARSYVVLHREGEAEDISSGYSRAAFEQHAEAYGKGDFEVRFGFRDRFTGSCPDEYTTDELYFNCGHGATFWLRRSLDGTDDEVWQIVVDVLKRYDPQFLNGLAYTPQP